MRIIKKTKRTIQPYVDPRATIPFICPDCRAESHNPNDMENDYCGRCKEFKTEQMSKLYDEHWCKVCGRPKRTPHRMELHRPPSPRVMARYRESDGWLADQEEKRAQARAREEGQA